MTQYVMFSTSLQIANFFCLTAERAIRAFSLCDIFLGASRRRLGAFSARSLVGPTAEV